MDRSSMNRVISIAGAGPAGLAAAIALARRGVRARVYERQAEVGARFHGDFQGIENWSGEGNVLDELGTLGIDASFDHAPVRECVIFDPDGREHVCRSPDPIFYLVRRGSMEGTLDQSLKRQALAAGAELRFGTPMRKLPPDGIVTHGPRRADVIAMGYVGNTDLADGTFGVLSDQMAPQGYAYLLVWKGQATLSVCLFTGFREAKQYLERTREFFRAAVGLTLKGAKRFGGYGNFAGRPRLRQGNLLFAGEAAGIQDALFGFGMRLALVSGSLAGSALAVGDPQSYERICGHRVGPAMRVGITNRMIYARAGEFGYRRLLRRLTSTTDPRQWLRRFYSTRWWTAPLFELVQRTRA
jgi:flavin-dependent dehydrogenase